jgi:hypothetical protein
MPALSGTSRSANKQIEVIANLRRKAISTLTRATATTAPGTLVDPVTVLIGQFRKCDENRLSRHDMLAIGIWWQMRISDNELWRDAKKGMWHYAKKVSVFDEEDDG